MATSLQQEAEREAFAERLRQAVRRRGIQPSEQKRLGDLFGVTGQAARKWVDGTNLPTRNHMVQIADALGVRRGWLEYGEGPMFPQRRVAESAAPCYDLEGTTLDEHEVRLLVAFRGLDIDNRLLITTLVERLVARDPSADPDRDG